MTTWRRHGWLSCINLYWWRNKSHIFLKHTSPPQFILNCLTLTLVTAEMVATSQLIPTKVRASSHMWMVSNLLEVLIGNKSCSFPENIVAASFPSAWGKKILHFTWRITTLLSHGQSKMMLRSHYPCAKDDAGFTVHLSWPEARDHQSSDGGNRDISPIK